ncbi:MAG: KOW domain-containing RNA-binding protein [Firmicutes bacterium]|nr:KOW domain-containing RNA-binding protein [Bacillota bacterium]
MESNFKIGAVVMSKSGRDKGRYFIICKIISAEYVLLTDGHIRKIAKPKLKKVKHITLTKDCCDIIAAKFEENKNVFDSEIFSALKNFNTSETKT